MQKIKKRCILGQAKKKPVSDGNLTQAYFLPKTYHSDMIQGFLEAFCLIFFQTE
jgi:hypothetical protein